MGRICLSEYSLGRGVYGAAPTEPTSILATSTRHRPFNAVSMTTLAASQSVILTLLEGTGASRRVWQERRETGEAGRQGHRQTWVRVQETRVPPLVDRTRACTDSAGSTCGMTPPMTLPFSEMWSCGGASLAQDSCGSAFCFLPSRPRISNEHILTHTHPS